MQYPQEERATEVFVFDTQTVDILELEETEEWQMEILSDRRRHPRALVTVLHILELEAFRELEVIDLSSQGICIQRNGWRFTLGEQIVFDIIYKDRFVIKNAKARVRRVDDTSIGCEFMNISSIVGAKLMRFAVAAT